MPTPTQRRSRSSRESIGARRRSLRTVHSVEGIPIRRFTHSIGSIGRFLAKAVDLWSRLWFRNHATYNTETMRPACNTLPSCMRVSQLHSDVSRRVSRRLADGRARCGAGRAATDGCRTGARAACAAQGRGTGERVCFDRERPRPLCSGGLWVRGTTPRYWLRRARHHTLCSIRVGSDCKHSDSIVQRQQFVCSRLARDCARSCESLSGGWNTVQNRLRTKPKHIQNNMLQQMESSTLSSSELPLQLSLLSVQSISVHCTLTHPRSWTTAG